MQKVETTQPLVIKGVTTIEKSEEVGLGLDLSKYSQ
jgi:hypothetical protein